MADPAPKFGTGSCNFDGSGDRLSVIIPALGTENFTLEFWLYPRNGGAGQTYGRMAQVGSNSTNGGLWLARGENPNPLRFITELYSGDWIYVFDPGISPHSVANDTWHHVVLQRASGAFSLYIDGTRDQYQKTEMPGNNITQTTLYIGANDSLSEGFNGSIDDLRLSVGVARYSGSSFSVPVRPFPDANADNAVPELIVAPLSYEETTDQHTVELAASASDLEDGDIGAQIRWSSSIDGDLGIGGTLSTKLSLGGHVISASVTDSLGKRTTATLTLLVREITSEDDFDMDALSDAWEFEYFGDLQQTAEGDYDGDGINNLDEFLGGSDPADSDSKFGRVQLLLHCDGESGSTVVLDSSFTNRTVSVSGNAQISADPVPKFGTGSCKLDGSGDRLSVTVPALGTDDFTLEFWLYPRNGGGGQSYGRMVQIGSNSSDGGLWLARGENSNPLTFLTELYRSDWIYVFDPGISPRSVANETWHHVVLQREAGAFSLYINGLREQYQTGERPGNNIIQTTLYIGANDSLSEGFNGSIDDLRLSVGLARYSGESFTVPVRSFPDANLNNAIPELTIAPLGYEETSNQHTVELVATATDPEDGDISEQIRWTSSIDGDLGTGRILSTQLSLGNHDITASVTDSLGKSISATLSLLVREITAEDDFDEDGLRDAWEFQYFGDLQQTGEGDYDGDGVNNLDEYLGNSDPADADPDFGTVQLLLHCDGDEGSTALSDSSLANRGISVSGNAQVVADPVPKFGTGSCKLDGSGDRLSVSIPALGTDDFTLEFWLYPRNGGGGQNYGRIIQIGSNSSAGGLWLYRSGSPNPLTFFTGLYRGGYVNVFSPGVSPSSVANDTWHHIVLQRASGAFSLYIDGIRDQYQAVERPGNNLTQTTLYVGNNQSSSEGFNGSIDDLRLSVGVARYTGTSFTVPVRPFPDAGSSNTGSELTLIPQTSKETIDQHAVGLVATASDLQGGDTRAQILKGSANQ